jgi:hypothetical protein
MAGSTGARQKRFGDFAPTDVSKATPVSGECSNEPSGKIAPWQRHSFTRIILQKAAEDAE